MSSYIFIYKSNGNYLGFILNNFLYSRDGIYYGWIDGKTVWDAAGNFRGELFEINGNLFIAKNRLAIPPIARLPRVGQVTPTLPLPQGNIMAVSLPIGYEDGF